MTDPLIKDQNNLKGDIKAAYGSVYLSAAQKEVLRDLILQEPLAEKTTSFPVYTLKLLRQAHNWGLGYLAAAVVFGFTYLGPSGNNSDEMLSSDSAQIPFVFQPHRLNRLLPADFDLEGDYEGLPSVVQQVMGDSFSQSPRYEVKVPRKIRGQFAPGEGRFFATNKEHLGVSVSLQPQGTRVGFKPKTLYVLPREMSGSEIKQVLRDQDNTVASERLKKAVKWGRLINEPHDKTMQELVEEANSEMVESLDARTGAATWNSGQFRYVLYDE